MHELVFVETLGRQNYSTWSRKGLVGTFFAPDVGMQCLMLGRCNRLRIESGRPLEVLEDLKMISLTGATE
jgi:hypothetical protein